MKPLFLWPFPVLFPEHQNRLGTPIKAGCWGHTTAREGHPARGQEHPPPTAGQLLTVWEYDNSRYFCANTVLPTT